MMKKYFAIEWDDNRISGKDLDTSIEYWFNKEYGSMSEFKVTEIQLPCGHPVSAIVSSGEGTSYCRMCAEEESIEEYKLFSV